MKLGKLLDMLDGWRDMEVLNVSRYPRKDDMIEMGVGYSIIERSDQIIITFETPLRTVRINTKLEDWGKVDET